MNSLQYIALCIAGEAGELANEVKKIEGHGHTFDRGALEEEVGDLLWYLAVFAERCLHSNLGFVAQRNIEKLRRRYPDGFDPERSQNRQG